jgi:hypothetical protein
MAKKRRSCSLQIFAEHRLGNKVSNDETILATGSCSKPMPSIGQADATGRRARDELEACVEAIWDQRQHDLLPTVCKDCRLDLPLGAGESFLEHVAELVYDSAGQPQKGDLLITVKARTFGDRGCGPGESKSRETELGTIQVDLDTRTISSGRFQVEFRDPDLES